MRNYQAHNMMRDQRQVGDKVFLPRGRVVHYSGCEVPGIAGIARVASRSYADFAAFDKQDKHYDSRGDLENPRWFLVDVAYVKKLKRMIPLAELKQYKALEDMQLLRKRNRLFVMPVTEQEWKCINNIV